MTRWVSSDGLVELRLGDNREVLDDVTTCDAVITDPPFSTRTHEGAEDAEREARLGYDALSVEEARALMDRWHAMSPTWIAAMTDDVLAPVFRERAAELGRYDFAPVPIIQPRRRGTGDGPPSCAVYLMASRPRERGHFQRWYPAGYYHADVLRGGIVHGAKPVSLMRRVVGDYTKHGALVVDPFAGGCSTLIACGELGRRCIGAEVDEGTFEKAVALLERGWTVDAFPDCAPRSETVDMWK